MPLGNLKFPQSLQWSEVHLHNLINLTDNHRMKQISRLLTLVYDSFFSFFNFFINLHMVYAIIYGYIIIRFLVFQKYLQFDQTEIQAHLCKQNNDQIDNAHKDLFHISYFFPWKDKFDWF